MSVLFEICLLFLNFKFDLCLTMFKISDGADGGPRSRLCARLTLRSAPHRHQQKFFGAHVWVGRCEVFIFPQKITLVSMGGRAEVQACADPGATTPIGASGNFVTNSQRFHSCCSSKENVTMVIPRLLVTVMVIVMTEHGTEDILRLYL